ncbi:uncharacterized protein LOC116286789 [Actinia tenebrosa]|uniref:Uncharacterized protein LOC116286789 n=1 Tax=Actinia tenebrosa TaxID=6105 RepID=A0A6P8H0L6_ACTTE|nr:uncharacterized protein LOC116286789 [Actinia tenebrosa]
MVNCFVPDCKHHSESHTCTFFTFPSKKKNLEEHKRWIRLIRRDDRQPGAHSRVCSCHFRNGQKSFGPEIFERNADKLFPCQDGPPRNKKKKSSPLKENQLNIQEILEEYQEQQNNNSASDTCDTKISTNEVLLAAELDMVKRDLEEKQQYLSYMSTHYSVSNLSTEVIRMETGLPTGEVFNIVVSYAARFKDSIAYFSGWKVDSLSFEDQIFLTLMKLRQNYTNLHLAQLFSCSHSTISNIIITFVHVLHELLFKDIMTTIPSRDKNKLSAPSSFSQFISCRIVIHCTDIECAAPGLMSQQSLTYSSYRGMNSFKVLVGVAPNGVITFVSNCYPGSISDKEIVKQSGLINHMQTGDLILTDKGFLIQDLVPKGIYVNIPPFLEHGKFTESEIKVTKSIARCRIHVERANARLKDFKILTFVPPYLRCHSDKLFQLCAALVNLQFPLIKEGCTNFEFE